MYHTIGDKYEATKNIKDSELVALIKKDLRDQLPKEYKVLAQKDVYAGGWSIHIQIKNTGIEKYLQTDHGSFESPEHKELYKKVQDIVEQYNFDDGDVMSDYFHVRFYAHIQIER